MGIALIVEAHRTKVPTWRQLVDVVSDESYDTVRTRLPFAIREFEFGTAEIIPVNVIWGGSDCVRRCDSIWSAMVRL